MARYRGPKNRIARRFGANIFGRARNPLLRKANPPGQHGARRRKKSDYGLQLEEKQKLKACYGMLLEKQMINVFKEAVQKKGNTTQLFVERLECRLDNLVYRLRFTRTIFGAQQLVSHGHILVDGKKVDRRSFYVQPGMEISIRNKSRKMKCIIDAMETASQKIPDYLELEKDQFRGKLLLTPQIDQIESILPIPVNIPVVCEFLAHRT
ncbi:MAG: 30S ribosomal protein S4 [Chlamydiales bacterium]